MPDPPPPQLPRNFTWTGRYEVPELGVELPFSWHFNAGNLQMIAGGENHAIHFTNLVYDGTLYTLTYKWPGVERRPCSPIGPFTLDDLNTARELALRRRGNARAERAAPGQPLPSRGRMGPTP